MQTPLVSIIIPTYNRAHLIGETLDSVIAQTYTNWECIVVDDGSSDATNQVLKAYCDKDDRIHYHHRPFDKPKGANACRNYGLKLSHGKYLIFFDSDDVMKNTCLEGRLEAIIGTKYDFVVFSMGRFENIRQLRIDENRIVTNKSIDKTILEFLKGRLPWNICRPIFRSEIIKFNDIKFNEELRRLQDIEFNIQVLNKLKPKYISIDTTDCYYRFNEDIANKYYTKSFSNQLFYSLFVYYQSIFKMFGRDYITTNRQIFINQYYTFVKVFCRKHTHYHYINFTIKLFKKYIILSLKELFALYLMIIINKFLYGKKGTYRLTKYFDRFIINNSDCE